MKRDLFTDYCLALVGKPYVWGGNNPSTGSDCSGFAQSILAAHGADAPGDQTAHDLYALLCNQSAHPRKGALAFYGDESNITHIAVCLTPYQVVEAGGGDSKTTSSKIASRLQDAMVRIRPLEARKDLFCVAMPDYPEWVEL